MIWAISLLALASSLSLQVSGATATRPLIFYPDKDAIWYPSERHKVQWDTSPESLAKLNNPRRSQQELFLMPADFTTLSDPLAIGFDLSIGGVEIEVPRIIGNGKYIVVLFGNEDASEPFQILNLPRAPIPLPTRPTR